MVAKSFRYDALVEEKDFCNYQRERQQLAQDIKKNRKILVTGRRNFGKTSLIRNIVGYEWAQRNKGAFVLYVDFYGVRSMSGLVSRLSAAFTDAFQKAFPTKSIFNSMLDSIKRLRPKVEMDQDGRLSLALGLGDTATKNLTAIFQEIGSVHQSGVPVLVVFDEFQDVHFVEEAEGLIRGAVESTLGDLPIVILGSKKHLLAQMFSMPNAPFFNWGHHVEISFIPYDEYTEYANERLAVGHLHLDVEASHYLQDLMGRVPEAMNRLADMLLDSGNGQKQKVTRLQIDDALALLTERRCGAVEEYISHFTEAEEKFLITLARSGGKASMITGKEFVTKTGLSIGGIRKVVKKLENDAVIYRENNSYCFADPLICHHLAKYRG